MKDSYEFNDDFFGAGDLTDRYGVVGTPTMAADRQGASLQATGGAAEVAVHFGDKLQIDAALLTEFEADFNISESAGVADGNSFFIGLINEAYAADLSTVAKRIGVTIAASGAASKSMQVVGTDGTTVVTEDVYGDLLHSRPNRLTINVARGWEEAEVYVNGRPVGGYLDLTAIRGETLQPVAQIKGSGENYLILSGWSFRGRKSI